MNNNILRIQKGLNRLGLFAKLTEDGINGPQTSATLNKYKVWKSTQPKGPDVSAYQPHIDWDKLSKSADFIIMRSSVSLSKDKLFKEHWSKAGAAGLKRGAYHFFTPWQDPIKQAELVVSQLGDDTGDFPVFLDVETVAPKAKKGQPAPKPASSSELISKVKACLEALEILTGVKPIIYTYSAFSQAHKLGYVFGKEYKVWMADYREGPSTLERDWKQVIGHQWIGDQGRFEGVEGPCDCNYLEVKLEEVLVASCQTTPQPSL